MEAKSYLLEQIRELREQVNPYPDIREMDFTQFCEDEIGLSTAPLHRAWDLKIDSMLKTVGKPRGYKYGCTIAPFRHGKSYRLVVAMPVYALLKNPELRILNVSAVEAQAFRQTSTAFEIIKQKYPKLRHKDKQQLWSPLKFTVNRRGFYQEASYTALGLFGSGITGGHWDIIVGDDICTQSNTRTPHQRLLTGEWIRMTLMGRLEPGGFLWLIGSRWHPQDFYNEVTTLPELKEKFSEPKGFTTVDKAILRWPDETKGETEGEIAWPSLVEDDGGWTWDRLMDIWSTMGSIIASLQMQNDPMPTEGKMLKGSWLHPFEWSEFPSQSLITEAVIPLDPAFSTQEPGDWCAAACLIKDRYKKIYLVDAQHWHLTWTDFVETELEIFVNNMRNQVERGAKDSRIQWRLIPEINSLGGKNEYIKWQHRLQELGILGEIPMFGVSTSKNKETRFGIRAAFYQNETVLVAEHLCAVNHPFFEEWVGFPDYDHDDLIDAADIGLEYLLQTGRGHWA